MLHGDLGLKGYSDPHEQYTNEQWTDEQCPYQTIPGQKPGSGAFATVHQAKSRNNFGPQQFFALKEIVVKNEDWLEDVRAEIRILKGLRHDNILALEEAFYSKADPCKVYLATLPWAPQSLYDFFWNLLETDPLHNYEWYVPGDLDQWPTIVFQCSRGLAYLHNEKIKHKDLKPHNILLLQEKNQEKNQKGEISIRPIIADFGISKNFESGGKTDSRGTHEFKAPEQFLPDQRSELHSDIWSLGCCFAFIWILLHSRKKGLADLWEKIMRSKRDERGFHTESNIKATHELLETSLTLPKDSGMSAFMQEFGALVKDMLNVKPSDRPEAWIIALRLIRLNRNWVKTSQLQLRITQVREAVRGGAGGLKKQIIEQRKRAPGQERPDTLTSLANLKSTMVNLKSTLFDEGPWKEVWRAIPKRREWKSFYTLRSQYLKRMEDADKLYAQVMQTKERAPEEVDSRELDDIANLASELSSKGWSEEAERFYLQVMELRRKVLGREDPSTFYSMDKLLEMYWRLNRPEEIELLTLPFVEMTNRVLGQEDPYTMFSMMYLAMFWRLRGDRDKGLQLAEETFERSKLILGTNNPLTLASLAILNELRKMSDLEPISPDQHASSG